MIYFGDGRVFTFHSNNWIFTLFSAENKWSETLWLLLLFCCCCDGETYSINSNVGALWSRLKCSKISLAAIQHKTHSRTGTRSRTRRAVESPRLKRGRHKEEETYWGWKTIMFRLRLHVPAANTESTMASQMPGHIIQIRDRTSNRMHSTRMMINHFGCAIAIAECTCWRIFREINEDAKLVLIMWMKRQQRSTTKTTNRSNNAIRNSRKLISKDQSEWQQMKRKTKEKKTDEKKQNKNEKNRRKLENKFCVCDKRIHTATTGGHSVATVVWFGTRFIVYFKMHFPFDASYILTWSVGSFGSFAQSSTHTATCRPFDQHFHTGNTLI